MKFLEVIGPIGPIFEYFQPHLVNMVTTCYTWIIMDQMCGQLYLTVACFTTLTETKTGLIKVILDRLIL